MGLKLDGFRVGWVQSGWRRDFQRWVMATYFGTGKMFVYLRNLGTTGWVSTSLLVLSLKMLERRVLYTDCEQEFHQGLRPPVECQCRPLISGRGSQCLVSWWRNDLQDLFFRKAWVSDEKKNLPVGFIIRCNLDALPNMIWTKLEEVVLNFYGISYFHPCNGSLEVWLGNAASHEVKPANLAFSRRCTWLLIHV